MSTIFSQKKARRTEVDFTDPFPAFPREVFLDLNNTCNGRCAFCSNRKISEYAYMDKKLAFRIIKECVENGTEDLAPYALGEPFMRQDLAEFIEYAKGLGFKYIFLTSNGTLATPERAKPALDAGLDSIKFSVNAGTRETYRKVHGNDLFEAVIKNIKWFREYREKSGLKYGIYVSMVPTSISVHEWPILNKILSPYVDEIDLRGCSNQGGNMHENNFTEKIDKKNLLGSLRKGQFSNRCPDIFFRCTVTTQGFLSACVVDYQNFLCVADLNKTSLKEAWHNKIFVELRKRHISGDIKGTMCYNCLNNCNEPASALVAEFARPFKKIKDASYEVPI